MIQKGEWLKSEPPEEPGVAFMRKPKKQNILLDTDRYTKKRGTKIEPEKITLKGEPQDVMKLIPCLVVINSGIAAILFYDTADAF